MYEISAESFIKRLIGGEIFRDFIINGDVNCQGENFGKYIFVEYCHFNGSVNFNGCHFEYGASFEMTTFSKDVDFSYSRFNGEVKFWRARFKGDASFENVMVQSRADEYFCNADPSEVNFSWAHFTGKASFIRTKISSPATFYRTLFLAEVSFNESLFGGLTRFVGGESKVCIDLYELGIELGWDPSKLFFYLQNQKQKLIEKDYQVLYDTPDHKRWHRFVQLAVNSETDLCSKLKTIDDPRLSESLLEIYRKDARPMFSASSSQVTMELIDVAPTATITFEDIDMSCCRILGTSMERSIFSNIRWVQKKIFLGLVIRYATADENESGRKYPAALQRLYRELAIRYEQSQEPIEASRFRIAHREIARRRIAFWPHLFISVYRFLAVYGESPALATFWLLFSVTVFFPMLFVVASCTGIADAVVRSLEVSTFLTLADKSQNWSIACRFIAGAERVVVTTVVAVLLLAMKRILPP